MANKTFYLDTLSEQWCDVLGGKGGNKPQLTLGVVEAFNIVLLSGKSPLDVSGIDSWMVSVDDDFDSGTDVMCRTLDANIDSSAANVGKLVIEIDSTTAEYAAKVGDDRQITAYLEIKGFNSTPIKVFAVQGEIIAKNTVDSTGGSAPTPLPVAFATSGATATPDPAQFSMSYYIDAETSTWRTAANGKTDSPVIYYAGAAQWKLTIRGKDLSSLTAFYVAAGNAFQMDPPVVRSPNDAIDSTEKADGILYVVLDTRTSNFQGLTFTNGKASGYLQLYGLNASSEPVLTLLLPVILSNAVDGGSDTPPTTIGNYYTKSESDARYILSSAIPIQVTLSSAPTPSTALATIDPAAGAGSWGYFQGYKYTWPTLTRCERTQPEDNW